MPIPYDAKYTPPTLPQLVSRSRLTRRLRRGSERPLVLVVGQAAQGKSTLVADALSSPSSPVAWFHVEPRDGQSENLYQGLVNALARALPDTGLHEFLEQAHISTGASKAAVRYEALLNAMWQRLPEELTLVLDNLEQLPPSSPSLDLCRNVVALCAVRCRLIMISRETPPFKLQRWVMHRKLRIIDNEELAFTIEEIADFFQLIHGYALSSQMAAHVKTVTGGWPGGLVLLSQSIDRIPQDQWPEFLSKRIPSGKSDQTWVYFAEEVFDALPEKIQEILIHAALLDTIDPEVIEGLLGHGHAAEALDEVAQRNLFTQALDNADGRPLFRLNQLFRQFLQSQFQNRYDAASRSTVYRRIGEIYKERRKAEVAVDFFLKAQEPDAAAACLKKAGIDLVIRGRFSDLENALAALPTEKVTSDTWLFFFLTLTRRVKGGTRNIRDFETVVAAFEEQNDIRGQIMAMAYLIEAQIFSGNASTACGNLNQSAKELLKQQGDSPYYIYARTLLWLQIGFGYIASGLEISKGVSACRNAYLLAHKIDNPRLMANANIVAAMGLAARGDFEMAEEALKKITTFADTDAYIEYHALRHLVNAELSMRRGDLAAAQEHLKPLADEIETFGLLFIYPAYVDATGKLQIYRRDFENARATCRHLLDVSRISANAYYEGLSHRLNALRLYHQGYYKDAAAEAERALTVLPRDEQPTLHRMRALQLSGLIEIHLDAFASSEQRLKAAFQYYTRTGNTFSLCETQLCMAMLDMARGKTSAAIASLEQGCSTAAERQFSHFIILSTADLKTCCQWADRHLTAAPRAWSQHLHALVEESATVEPASSPDANYPVHAPGAKAKAEDVSNDPPTDENVPYLIINTLGRFQVLQNGRHPIDDKQWGGNRTKLFLKAILVHGIQDVPKEIIIEDLWPESSPSSAMQNFKVTLHRLRKCLEPGLSRHQRSSFIHLKNNLVSLDNQRCRVDVQTFLKCCKEIKREELNGETRAIGPLGEQLMELYQGDFLPEEPYAPWVEMKRKALQDQYFAALMTTADVFDGQGQPESAIRCCKAIIALDACMEQAVEKLMILSHRIGHDGDAIKAYSQLKSALIKELDVAPAKPLTKLYHALRTQK